MKTLVIHYDKLVDRKAYLDTVLIDPIYVTDFSKDLPHFQAMSNNFYSSDENAWVEQSKNIYREAPPFKILTPGMVSCAIGHFMSWDFASNQAEPTLIIEDDAILCNDFYTHLDRLKKKLDQKWDVFFVGGAFHHDICKTLQNEGELLRKDHPASNTVCGYLISSEAADRLCNVITPFTLPIDFAMNYWMKQLNFRVWHANPYIIREGTSAGFYPSSQVRV